VDGNNNNNNTTGMEWITNDSFWENIL
jgi:hypothetical protein